MMSYNDIFAEISKWDLDQLENLQADIEMLIDARQHDEGAA